MFELSDTQNDLQQHARTLASKEFAPRAAEIDRSEAYPWDNVETLAKAGFMGFTLPEEYGGQGLGYLEVLLIVEEIAKVCGVTARIVVEGNMGAIGAIMEYGSEKQKRLAAELVLAGDKPAICITEPGAGSAASQMTTRADRKGDRYVINGSKHWITGGGVSRLHLIFARVFEDGVEQGIAGFIVVRDADAGTPAGLQDRPPREDHGPARHSGNRDLLRGPGGPRRHGADPARRLAARLRRADERVQRPAPRRRHGRPGDRRGRLSNWPSTTARSASSSAGRSPSSRGCNGCWWTCTPGSRRRGCCCTGRRRAPGRASPTSPRPPRPRSSPANRRFRDQ